MVKKCASWIDIGARAAKVAASRPTLRPRSGQGSLARRCRRGPDCVDDEHGQGVEQGGDRPADQVDAVADVPIDAGQAGDDLGDEVGDEEGQGAVGEVAVVLRARFGRAGVESAGRRVEELLPIGRPLEVDPADEDELGDEQLVGVEVVAAIPVQAIKTQPEGGQQQRQQGDDDEPTAALSAVPGPDPEGSRVGTGPASWAEGRAGCHHTPVILAAARPGGRGDPSRSARDQDEQRARVFEVQMDRLRVVFFGTPAFAVPTLAGLAADDQFEVALVVTQPDRPAGRGRRLEASAVAQAARELGLPLYQPSTLREREPRANRSPRSRPTCFVVAAYGLIFGPRTLALPRLGCVNVHASLLPRYRGASPVAAAILAGDETSGVTLMGMEPGLDTGPIIAAAEEPIQPDDTTERLTARLAAIGGDLTVASLPLLAAGELVPVDQPADDAQPDPAADEGGRSPRLARERGRVGTAGAGDVAVAAGMDAVR